MAEHFDYEIGGGGPVCNCPRCTSSTPETPRMTGTMTEYDAGVIQAMMMGGVSVVPAPNYANIFARVLATYHALAEAENAAGVQLGVNLAFLHRKCDEAGVPHDMDSGTLMPEGRVRWLCEALAASQQEVEALKRKNSDVWTEVERLNALCADYQQQLAGLHGHATSLAASLALAQKDGERLRDVLDCGTNALLDSILASGNDDRTNLHWVRKMRRDSGLDPASPPPETTQGEHNGA